MTAKDSQFSPTDISGPGGVAFRIAFTNSDALPHNVAIATQGGVEQFQGKIVIGVQTITYAVPALPAGAYRLACTVHPLMTGTLTLS